MHGTDIVMGRRETHRLDLFGVSEVGFLRDREGNTFSASFSVAETSFKEFVNGLFDDICEAGRAISSSVGALRVHSGEAVGGWSVKRETWMWKMCWILGEVF